MDQTFTPGSTMNDTGNIHPSSTSSQNNNNINRRRSVAAGGRRNGNCASSTSSSAVERARLAATDLQTDMSDTFVHRALDVLGFF